MVKVSGTKKEYKDLTYEQVKKLVSLMREGKTEEEALEMIAND